MVSGVRFFTSLRMLLSAAMLLPGALRAETAVFHHKQWQAHCGPEYCTLTPRAYPVLSLMRGHESGDWVLSFRDRAMVDEGAILIDGVAMGWQQDRAMAFPTPLLDGNTLEIAYESEGFSEGVSLAGIKAAMLWAEEQQGRMGTRRLMLHQPDWEALQAEARKITEEMCDGPLPGVLDNEAGPQEIEGHPEVRVLSQLCWTAAYNVGSQVYLLGPELDGVAPVRLAAVDPEGAAEPELALWGIEGDTRVLDSFYKGRGLGDCFTHETWRFDGFAYRLERRIVDDACDEKIIPMITWPE
ncbi:MAG: DUF1176 domain-containing protein [Rhodobacteraceae bacterium]|nr:MAG: DUF1176 domain-containing protein [Paracoccaceae bacterium]